MKASKPLFAVQAVLTALLVLSASIAVPILCRPFYYAHIPSIQAFTGGTVEEIRLIYDQVMDYCLGLRPDFAAGGLPFSESGASHFADVRVLFQLDLAVAALSLVLLILVFFVSRRTKRCAALVCGRGPGFWAGAGLLVIFVVVGLLAATNFDRAFVIFHSLFFPGKTNWIFDWQTDPVILFLPEEFFRNCAILILALLILWCVVLILADLWSVRRRKKFQAEHNGPCGPCGGCSGCQA